MGQQHGAYIERREPTMGAGRPLTAAVDTTIRNQKRPKDHLALWLTGIFTVLWLLMFLVCKAIADSIGGANHGVNLAAMVTFGSVLMVATIFWRVVWGVVRWLIALVVVLAIIKGAFLVVFGL